MNESNYQKIAQTVNEIIPGEWSKVILYGEITVGTGTAFIFYHLILMITSYISMIYLNYILVEWSIEKHGGG
ncbi:immunity protein YezG family protein [Peribacillus sp. RS7]|uniref:immunity protein YezG family protein n=1 Tax=unclassified Peribacillus TaxID=2675266 RepID=UPI0025A2ED11|nr:MULTISPECIES: immunity protein YezG family protein [unclassified Peribacillus]MDM5212682.1 DUF600 family protein [Peribacillus sp. NJ4]MDM5358773.1 DUF600 family protein [Peribacillus sp. ACCC06369]